MDKGFRGFETSRQRSRQPPVDVQGLEAGDRREVEVTSLRLTSRVEAPVYKGISEEYGRLGGYNARAVVYLISSMSAVTSWISIIVSSFT